MKMEFNVQAPDLNIQKDLTIDQAKEVLWKAMVKMEALAKQKVPVGVSGNLKARINLNPTQKGAKEYTLSDGVEYGIYIEYGTKPHYVPIEPLKLWAKRKLKDENLAYAVRAKIAKEGTNAQPFFRPALHEVEQKWIPYYKKQIIGD